MPTTKKEVADRINELHKTIAELPEGQGKANALSTLSDLHNTVEYSLHPDGHTLPDLDLQTSSAFDGYHPNAGHGLIACCMPSPLKKGDIYQRPV